jgi:hypothetical protein
MYTRYPIAENLGALIDAFIERRLYDNFLREVVSPLGDIATHGNQPPNLTQASQTARH